MSRSARAGLLALVAVAAGLAASPVEAECIRSIVNRSGLVALVSRDGGPWVQVPPGGAQSIRYHQPGRLELALACPGAGPEGVVFRSAYAYTAILDRCYFRVGDGFFEAQIGPSFTGLTDTRPLTLNMPRQGDLVIGPYGPGRCPAAAPREGLRLRY